ncbi:hypothetical protein J7J74_03660 [bacterium]|nr:hypothetical protein [bacterium]
MANINDEIREKILKYLYEQFKKARSIRNVRVTDAMVGNALRREGYKQQDIVSNFIYLVQTGWIKKETESYSYDFPDYTTGKSKKIRGKQTYYTISDKGVNHFEGTSVFQKSHWLTGINVTNIQGVTIIGDNNFVHQEFGDLYRNLELLKEEIAKNTNIKDEDKLNYQSEIETIKSQLAKQNPNKNIIKEAWSALSSLATIEGLV